MIWSNALDEKLILIVKYCIISRSLCGRPIDLSPDGSSKLCKHSDEKPTHVDFMPRIKWNADDKVVMYVNV